MENIIYIYIIYFFPTKSYPSFQKLEQKIWWRVSFSLICFCLRTPSQLSGIRWFLGNQPGTTGEARNWCNRNQNEILKIYRNPSRNLTSDNFEYYQDYHCDLFIFANLGQTLIFFQHTSGVRVTHGFGGSIGATSILPRSSSWRWVFVHCDEKTNFVLMFSTRLRFTLGFDSKPQFFAGKLSRKTSFVCQGVKLLHWVSIFHLCHSHRCLILCSMFLVFRAYLYKIASSWRWIGKKRLSTGLLQALRLLLTLQLPLGFVGQRQLGKLCIAQLAHLSRNASKNDHCFPGYASFYWNWHRQLDLLFISFHTKRNIFNPAKSKNKNLHKTCKDSKEPRFISKKKRVFSHLPWTVPLPPQHLNLQSPPHTLILRPHSVIWCDVTSRF